MVIVEFTSKSTRGNRIVRYLVQRVDTPITLKG